MSSPLNDQSPDEPGLDLEEQTAGCDNEVLGAHRADHQRIAY